MDKLIRMGDLTLNPRNPRTITAERFAVLVQSLKTFPAMMELRPIIADANGMILGGNMRYRALVQLGYKNIPSAWVKRADQLSQDEMRRFVLMDNEGFGEWDDGILSSDYELPEIEAWGIDLERLGLQCRDVKAVIEDAPGASPRDGPFRCPKCGYEFAT